MIRDLQYNLREVDELEITILLSVNEPIFDYIRDEFDWPFVPPILENQIIDDS